jgi:hypothetical protein
VADPPARGPVWPHRGLVSSVTPSPVRQGMPEAHYRYRHTEQRRELDTAYRLAEIHAERCPGPTCQRYARQHCPEVCGWGEAPTIPMHVIPYTTGLPGAPDRRLRAS